MTRVVSVLAALLSMIVPASGSPLVPALRSLSESLEFLSGSVN